LRAGFAAFAEGFAGRLAPLAVFAGGVRAAVLCLRAPALERALPDALLAAAWPVDLADLSGSAGVAPVLAAALALRAAALRAVARWGRV